MPADKLTREEVIKIIREELTGSVHIERRISEVVEQHGNVVHQSAEKVTSQYAKVEDRLRAVEDRTSQAAIQIAVKSEIGTLGKDIQARVDKVEGRTETAVIRDVVKKEVDDQKLTLVGQIKTHWLLLTTLFTCLMGIGVADAWWFNYAIREKFHSAIFGHNLQAAEKGFNAATEMAAFDTYSRTLDLIETLPAFTWQAGQNNTLISLSHARQQLETIAHSLTTNATCAPLIDHTTNLVIAVELYKAALETGPTRNDTTGKIENEVASLNAYNAVKDKLRAIKNALPATGFDRESSNVRCFMRLVQYQMLHHGLVDLDESVREELETWIKETNDKFRDRTNKDGNGDPQRASVRELTIAAMLKDFLAKRALEASGKEKTDVDRWLKECNTVITMYDKARRSAEGYPDALAKCINNSVDCRVSMLWMACTNNWTPKEIVQRYPDDRIKAALQETADEKSKYEFIVQTAERLQQQLDRYIVVVPGLALTRAQLDIVVCYCREQQGRHQETEQLRNRVRETVKADFGYSQALMMQDNVIAWANQYMFGGRLFN